MRRLGAVLGGVLLAVIIGVVTITTQVQFGDGETLADRVPVVGELARSLDQGPLVILPSDDEKALQGATCGELWSAPVSGRLALVSPLAQALSDQSGNQVDAQTVWFVDGACQTERDDQSIDVALRHLIQRATASSDYSAELCRMWKADLSDVHESAAAVDRSTQAVFDALEGEGDLRPFYDALVTAEQVTRAAADRTGELELKTHAGRAMATLASEAQRGAANAHRRFIGRSDGFESWSGRPSSQANYRRWTRRLENGRARFVRGLQLPSFTPGLVDEECRRSVAALGSP